jgi:hypothetical protein
LKRPIKACGAAIIVAFSRLSPKLTNMRFWQYQYLWFALGGKYGGCLCLFVELLFLIFNEWSIF